MADFLAEVSSNHHQDLSRCLEFVDCAADIGCSGVKFQLFKIEELFTAEVLNARPGHRDRKNWELPVEFLPELKSRCDERDIEFSVTPFYLKAVEELEPFVDFYKIASYELLWSDLLRRCGETGKPVVLSTGMATMEEVNGAVETLRESGCSDLTLLHCTSSYPTPTGECNLKAIETMRKEFGCEVGWSDHSVSSGVIHRAIGKWGASVIEFHLDLEGEGEEFTTGHCWLPDQMKELIQEVNDGEVSDGNGAKGPSDVEINERDWRADPRDGLRPLEKIRGTDRINW